MRRGGQILVDQLAIQGVGTVFTVPGESFLAALDALRDATAITTVVCRHEGGATLMAEATARLTGRPSVAFVTRAPGAANALSGVVVAAANATPLLLLIGMTPTTLAGRGGLQDIDVAGVFAPVAKLATVCGSTARLPEVVARCCHTALSGRLGPVVLGLPQDVLDGMCEATNTPATVPAISAPAAAPLAELATALRAAQHPLLIVAGPGWHGAAKDGLEAFARAWDLPVAAAFRRQDAFDNSHPCYVGHAGIGAERKLAAAIRASDLLMLAGAPPDDVTSAGWSLITAPRPAQRLVVMTPDATEAGRVVQPDIALLGSPEHIAAALLAIPTPHDPAEPGLDVSRSDALPWATWRRDLRRAYEASRLPPTALKAYADGRADLATMFHHLSQTLPGDAVVCNGAGNYATFIHRYVEFSGNRISLAPLSGSMGYGLPSAIAGSLLYPERSVVAIAGDGCFQMTGQELATAAQYGLSLLLIVVDNGGYGTIRAHQEHRYAGRPHATRLVNPDFCALAQSFGASASRVGTNREFADAVGAMLPRSGLRVIVVDVPDDWSTA